ncbi:MAG: hypothetical protein ACM3VX_09150 [Bacteroidota bacterium]
MATRRRALVDRCESCGQLLQPAAAKVCRECVASGAMMLRVALEQERVTEKDTARAA